MNNSPGQNGAPASPVVSASSVELAKVLERRGTSGDRWKMIEKMEVGGTHFLRRMVKMGMSENGVYPQL